MMMMETKVWIPNKRSAHQPSNLQQFKDSHSPWGLLLRNANTVSSSKEAARAHWRLHEKLVEHEALFAFHH
jgi:hypothetical protein